MKLSDKKKTELYRIVSDDIMMARIRIAKILNGRQDGVPIDDILSELGKTCPQKAIDFFNPSPSESR